MSVDLAAVQRFLQFDKFRIRQFHIRRVQIVDDVLLILGAGDVDDVRVFVQHPRQRNLCGCSVFLRCIVLQMIDNWLIAIDILLTQS